jgi:hypothetical protein
MSDISLIFERAVPADPAARCRFPADLLVADRLRHAAAQPNLQAFSNHHWHFRLCVRSRRVGPFRAQDRISLILARASCFPAQH